ncbi:chymotrypsinogen 2-like [Tubulanus polymorphus]|uniref:chymotrypsinogen 2-like n=1 Tax=Tubulanus polymorphus TaxID=672921 RepID=UPI003DA2DE33
MDSILVILLNIAVVFGSSCYDSGGGCLPEGTTCFEDPLDGECPENGVCCKGYTLCEQLNGGYCQDRKFACDQYTQMPGFDICGGYASDWLCCLNFTHPVIPPTGRPPRPSLVTTDEITEPTTTLPPTTTTREPFTFHPIVPFQNHPDCGRSKWPAVGNWRITHGWNAQKGAWPWQVSIQMGGSGGHFCGGSIISEQWVVSASHCFYPWGPQQVHAYTVVVGDTNVYEDDGPEVTHELQAIFMHPWYDGRKSDSPHDIVLLKLKKPIVFNDYVKPICLPQQNDDFTNWPDCWVTGWGETKSTQNRAQLQQVQGPLIPNEECDVGWRALYKRPVILENHICFGRGYIGSCQGDSGGPVQCRKEGRVELAGVVSFGHAVCNHPGYPSVSTRVSKYIDWIQHIMSTNQ